MWLSAICNGPIDLQGYLQGLLLSQGPARQDSLRSHGLTSSPLQKAAEILSNYRCCLLLPAQAFLINFQPGRDFCLRHVSLLYYEIGKKIWLCDGSQRL